MLCVVVQFEYPGPIPFCGTLKLMWIDPCPERERDCVDVAASVCGCAALSEGLATVELDKVTDIGISSSAY